jgi:hypothetical protein
MKEKREKKFNQTPARVAPRLEGVVKNVGIKPKKKLKKKHIA